MNDARIQDWCFNGDQHAFRDFYREQSPRLWKFLLARGCDRELAYDIVSETFLRFVQVVCRDPRSPVALLYRIALNLRVDAFRRQQVAPSGVESPTETLETAGFPEPAEQTDVRALVSALPENEQNLLLMRYWIGLSHKEVAQALDLPEGTVRRQCMEILTRLHEKLERE